MQLDQIAEREDQVASAMERVSGYVEDRLPQVAQLGVEDEYRSIFECYVQLLNDPEQGLEALRRATFLAWYSFAEPTWLSGLGDLPDNPIRRVMETLDAALGGAKPDTELVAMLNYYIGVIPLPFDKYPDLQQLRRFVHTARTDEDRSAWRPRMTQRRGLMGDYWSSLRSDV